MMKSKVEKNAVAYADAMHRMALEMARYAGKSGCHIGGSFSAIEILSVLYAEVLNLDRDDPLWEGRDRFVASKSHCVLARYPAAVLAGYLDERDLFTFHDDNGLLVGHPQRPDLGLEFCGGSLAMGIGVAVGMAMAAKAKGSVYRVFVLVGDGECDEGAVWESVMAAVKYKLDNLTIVVDNNNLQYDGTLDEIMPLSGLAERFRAFGVKAVEADGHKIESLSEAFKTEHSGCPLAIVAHTIKAHGVPSLENRTESHYAVLSDDDYNCCLQKSGGGL